MPNILSLVYRHVYSNIYNMFTDIFEPRFPFTPHRVLKKKSYFVWSHAMFEHISISYLKTYMHHYWWYIYTYVWNTRCKDIFKQILFTISNSKTCSYTYAQFFLLVYHIVAIFRRFSELFLCVLLHCTNIALKKTIYELYCQAFECGHLETQCHRRSLKNYKISIIYQKK